ncbi:DUF2911 domain-containing protein [Aquimarina addita]|uniref:DUF2911 domain-containing protein n=1 Tax=Aquimarina addita TaxID=870485 RepID=A0ABP6UZJ6_9FLAO
MRILYIILFICTSYQIQAQLNVPSLSPNASLKQTVGLTEIEINYSRPSIRKRTIFGEKGLLPYGTFWRVGANTATKISFSNEVNIMGNNMDSGAYTILAKPSSDIWKLYWYPYTSGNWSTYVEKEPLFITEIPVEKTPTMVETMEIHFNAITFDAVTLIIEWEHTKLNIPIKVPTKQYAIKSIDNIMSGPSTNDYFRAALYLHESNTDLSKALTYIKKVTSSENALFFQVTREALYDTPNA